MKAFVLTRDQQIRSIALVADRWNNTHISSLTAMAHIWSLLHWKFQKRKAKRIASELEAYDANRGKI